MPVGEMLSRISSYEITEWMAYEKAQGPLLSEYRDDMLASIHEQLQFLCHLYGSQFEENPVDEPVKLPRPNDLYDWVKRDEVDDEPSTVFDIANVTFD